MKIVRQLSVFLANRPGALAELIQTLAAQKVNVQAFTVSDTTDHAVVRMVVDQPQKALFLLGEIGTLCVENEVVEIPLANRPGMLQSLAAKLAGAKVNIEYAYGSAGSPGSKGSLYVRVSDPARLKKALARK